MIPFLDDSDSLAQIMPYCNVLLQFQVRKSFFNDLNINNNVTVVDLLYQQFFTGSEKEPSREERLIMRNLFSSERYEQQNFDFQFAWSFE